MRDHPFVNVNLRVEAIGFRLWNDHWFGVLITPWFLNLIAVPARKEGWEPHREGALQEWTFPGGSHSFRSDREQGIGEYQSCSVLSSVVHLPDQDHAARAAEAILRVLFSPPAQALRPGAEEAVPGQHPKNGPRGHAGSMARLMTRRSFLRGSMFRD